MQILFGILIYFAVVIVAIVILGLLNTYLVERSPYQAKFVQGTVPNPLPDGFYPGIAHVLMDKQTPWLGKSFDRERQIGFNVFTPAGAQILKSATRSYTKFSLNSDGTTNAYYFKTYVGKGKKDVNTDVIKLDYSSPENPWIIRIILDEIVAVAPDSYLGKIHVKFLPGFFVTVGYFSLRK